MCKSLIIAAALLASSPAGAQVYGAGCRGQTMSDLARCAVARAPVADAVAPETGEVAPLVGRTLTPTSLGGALQPADLRTAPPVVGRTVVPPPMSDVLTQDSGTFDPLADLRTDPASPFYTLGRGNTAREELRQLDPLAGSAFNPYMPLR